MICSVCGFQTWVDLVTFDILDFVVILGMSWISPYHVMLNSNSKTVTIRIPGRDSLEWEGVYMPKPANII